MSLTTSIALNVISELTSALDLVTASAPCAYKKTFSLSDGAGANQAQQIFTDQRTLAASATEDLDLAGTLTNAFGATITFTKVKAIIVVASEENVNNVNLTRPVANGLPLFIAAGDGVAIQPGGAFAFFAPTAAGVTVTASTGDLLTLTNSAGSTSVTYDVIIIGATG